MRQSPSSVLFSATIATGLFMAAPAWAATCGNGPRGFNSWLGLFKREAAAKRISQRTLDRARSGVTYKPKIIRLDRGQRSFKQSFARFYKRRASPWLLNKARGKLKRHARLLSRIEQRYRVPPEILVTIWGMESTFGTLSGKMNIIRPLATLAYDCRRSTFFTNKRLAAPRIVQRNDMSPARMRGGWAAKIGQPQFLASSYVKYAVDFDGNGHRNLIRSVPDVLASTANFLVRHGWQRGGAWGPGTHNFAILKQWNRASIYQRTIAKAAGVIASRR
jgi:lytic murein transglycosylase